MAEALPFVTQANTDAAMTTTLGSGPVIGSSTDTMTTLTTPTTSAPGSFTTVTPLEEAASTETYGFITNMDSYIPVGVIRKRTTSNEDPTAAKEEGDDFPAVEVANLEKNHWIWTSTYAYHKYPRWSYVRVYVLPDDKGRKTIPRSNTALRRALKTVMAKIDQSPQAWSGWLPGDWIDNRSPKPGSEDESLWYIFNTLQDPEPHVEKMRDPYARKAMRDLLSATASDGDAEIGRDYSGVLGLKTLLYPYQSRSAATMVQREVQPAQMLDPRLQMYTTPTGQEYYFDKEECNIVQEKKTYAEAYGGILAETMGCGKTLICLSVILATRGHFPQIPLEHQELEPPVNKKTASLVQMAAATAGRLSLPWKNHFERLKHSGSFHDKCVQACEEHRGAYTIPPPPAMYGTRNGALYGRPPRVRLSSGTLIVVPPNLVNHWLEQIGHHTEGLKVLVLRNNADVTPSPDDLLQYDIVLFSGVRFAKEAGKIDHQRGSTRPTDSHLSKIHWLRIIVDEGHNVPGNSGHRTNLVSILAELHVERRWIVSGTPSSGLYGVEVSLASHETNTSDTDMTEATTAVLNGRKKTGNAFDNELKDLSKLGVIVKSFLALKPWADLGTKDWTKYMKPVGEDGKRRKAQSLRATLQSLVVRHRMDVINSQVPLPRLHNKVVHLEPTFYDKMNLNLFIFLLAVNAVTSERKDQDYMFHPRNRKHLTVLISNLRQAGFWWTGSRGNDIPGTIETALKYLEKNRQSMTESDIAILTEGINIAQKAMGCESWLAFKHLQELGVFVRNFPSNAVDMWALNSSRAHLKPILLGIIQARHAQKFVTTNLNAYDPADGLVGAGIKVRSELAKRPSGFDSNIKATQNKPVTTKSPKKTFSKGLFKTLPLSSHLRETKLVATASAKLTYLLNQVVKLQQKEKIIIFYDNDDTAFWTAEGLDILGISFRIYANALNSTMRADYLTLFQESEEVRVLLMDLGQASHGLHIASASRVFIINPIWQPNVESQAIKRAHRIGQTKHVYVETLVLKDTLEDKMLQRRKAMSDTEIQHAERDLLDDSTMASIIQNEKFIPMPEDEGSAQLAFLDTPAGFFDRHKLPIPDTDETDDSSGGTLPKRKLTVSSTAEGETSTPKKRKMPDKSAHLSPTGILMTPSRPAVRSPWSSPSVVSSGEDTPGDTEGKKRVSIFG